MRARCGVAALCFLFAGAPAASAQQASVTAREMYQVCAAWVRQGAGATCREAAANVVRSEGAQNESPFKFCMPAEIKAKGDAPREVAQMFVDWFPANETRANRGAPMPDNDGYAMLAAAAVVTWPCS